MTATAERDTAYEQLAERNAELEAEKAALAGQLAKFETPIMKLRAEWMAEALDGATSAMRQAGRMFLTEEELDGMAAAYRREVENTSPDEETAA